MQIATVLYPGLTTLGAIGSYEVLRLLPDAEVRFIGAAPRPVDADSRVLIATAAGVDNARSSAAGVAVNLARSRRRDRRVWHATEPAVSRVPG